MQHTGAPSKRVSTRYKVMCGCECCIYYKNMHLYFLTWYDRNLKQLKDWSKNSQNRSYGKIASIIFETYKNSVRPHGFHINTTVPDMAMVTKCTCNYLNNYLKHQKYVLCCCDKCPSIIIPSQEANMDTPKKCTTINFNVNINVLRCTLHLRRPYKEKTTFSMYLNANRKNPLEKLYTQRELVLLETSIS